MPLTSPLNTLTHNPAMSSTLDQPPSDDIRMEIDSVESQSKTNTLDDEDGFSDFAEDPEELEIIDQLLLEVAAKQKQSPFAPLVVTDIEDYEAPRGIHLPKVFGLETTRQWDGRPLPAELAVDQNIQDQSCECDGGRPSLCLTDKLTSG